MARLKSALTTKAGGGDANAAEWRRLVDELNLRRRAAGEGGSAKSRERHVGRGKLLARERVAGLIDPGSAFLEIGALAAFGMYEGDVHGAGLVAGVGLVGGPRGHGRRERPDHQGRRLLPDDREEASPRPGDRRGERFTLRLSGRTWAGPIFLTRPRCFPTETISGGSSSIRRACRRSAFRRSLS